MAVAEAASSFVLLQICLDGAKSQMVIAIRRAPQMLDGHEDKRLSIGWSHFMLRYYIVDTQTKLHHSPWQAALKSLFRTNIYFIAISGTCLT